MGESVAQFAKSGGFNLEECQQFAQLDEKEARKRKFRANYAICQALLAADEGESLAIWQASDSLLWRNDKSVTFVKGNQNGDGLAFRRGSSSLPDADGGTVFEAGKLVEFHVRPKANYSYSDIISELQTKYGQPTNSFTNTLQNLYGAKFDVGEAAWEFGDGSEIRVSEDMLVIQGVGTVRPVTVTYRTKERVAEIAAQQHKPSALE
jgi:hypothetical protein